MTCSLCEDHLCSIHIHVFSKSEDEFFFKWKFSDAFNVDLFYN